jgi:HK97 family phage portal protein
VANVVALLNTVALGVTLGAKSYTAVPGGSRGWLSLVRESYTGAWQQNVEIDANRVLTNPTVWSCQTLIASDFAKLGWILVEKDSDGIWNETENPAFSPVLRKPNRFQTRYQFLENWALSKLSTGNTYILKDRDNRQVVVAQYILDPTRVTPLVSDDGRVFYQLDADNIAGIDRTVTVPASEIIHDRYNCLFHPLVGLSPIYAAGLAATQGLNIQQDATQFFGNRSLPGGLLLAPGKISTETANDLKDYWDTNFTGEKKGKIAVLGDGLKFEQMRVNAAESQVIEQLKWSDTTICSCYHVPPYKIGIGQQPTFNNVQALNVEYYSQALQPLVQAAEEVIDDGLGLGIEGATKRLGVEFQEGNLLRMDALTQMEVIDKGKNTMTPNEGRKRINLKPVKGGDVVLRQQQDYSLEALAKRDAKEDPFGKVPPAAPADDAPPEEDVSEDEITADAKAIILAEYGSRSLSEAMLKRGVVL